MPINNPKSATPLRGYVQEADGTLRRITGKPGPLGPQGVIGLAGSDTTMQVSATAPTTRLDSTPLEVGDRWLDSSVVPTPEVMIVSAVWSSASAFTGTNAWVKQGNWKVFVAPCDGVLVINGWVGIEIAALGKSGGTIMYSLNGSVTNDEIYAGYNYGGHGAGARSNYPVGMIRSLAAKDIYRFAPGQMTDTGITGTVTASALLLIFIPDGMHKNI